MVEHCVSFKGMLFSLQYFCGLIIAFKKKGNIELYIVIIDTSHIHGIINFTKGLLPINWCNEGTKDTFSLLNEPLFSCTYTLSNIIVKMKNRPIKTDKVMKLFSFALKLHIIWQFCKHFSTSNNKGKSVQ